MRLKLTILYSQLADMSLPKGIGPSGLLDCAYVDVIAKATMKTPAQGVNRTFHKRPSGE